MESVGQKLRDSRLRLRLTLDEVSHSTRINLKNLSAIEADELALITSPFHYRSFVKQFAACVNLDYETIAADVQSNASSMPEPLIPGQGNTPQIHVPALKPDRRLKLNWLRSVLSFSLVMAACTGMYAAWQNSHANWQIMVAQIGGQINGIKNRLNISAENVHTPKVSQASAPKVASSPSVQTSAPPPPLSHSQFHIQLAAIERTWLSIVSDGQEIYNGILDTAQTKVLEGHESARIRTGNAGGVTVTFNGKELGTLGPRGQVRTVIFTRNRYEVLPSAPEVSLSSFVINAE